MNPNSPNGCQNGMPERVPVHHVMVVHRRLLRHASRIVRVAHGFKRAPTRPRAPAAPRSRRNARSTHCTVSFSARLFCPSRSCKRGKVHPVERLVLVEAGEHDAPLAGRGIDLRLQTLRADLLHHALHRRVDRADRGVARAQEGGQQRRAGPPPTACIMRSEPIDDDAGRPRRTASPARRAGRRRRPPCPATMLPTKLRSCGAAGREAGRLVAAPDDRVGRALDLLDLVAVDHALVAGEIEHARTRRPQRRADREQHRVAQAAADQGDRAALRRCAVGVPVGPISTTGSPGRSRAQRSELPPISSTITETRPRAGSVQAPVIARPSIASTVSPPALAQAGGVRLEVLQAEELAGAEGARGGRRLDHHLDDVRRQAVHVMDARGESASRQAAIRSASRRRRPGRERRARRSGSRAWRCPSP